MLGSRSILYWVCIQIWLKFCCASAAQRNQVSEQSTANKLLKFYHPIKVNKRRSSCGSKKKFSRLLASKNRWITSSKMPCNTFVSQHNYRNNLFYFGDSCRIPFNGFSDNLLTLIESDRILTITCLCKFQNLNIV